MMLNAEYGKGRMDEGDHIRRFRQEKKRKASKDKKIKEEETVSLRFN